MIKRFISYFKRHKFLFFVDMSAAIFAGMLANVFPFLTRKLMSDIIPTQNLQNIFFIIAIMAGAHLLTAICNYVRLYWGHVFGVRVEADMRTDLFNHLQKLSFTYFDNVKTGHLMARISNDLNKIAEVAHHAPEDLMISIVTIVVSFIFMFNFNFHLALIALIPIPFLLLWGLKVGSKMRYGFRNVRQKVAEINTTVENSVQGIREVKSYANEDLEVDKFEKSNFNFKIAKEKMYALMAIFFSGMHLLRDFYYLLLISSGALLIHYGTLSIEDLLAFTLFINIILRPIERFVNFFEQFQQGAASFERFLDVMDIYPEINDASDAVETDFKKGNIKINKVDFKYDQSPEFVLKNINMNIPEGKKVALVGESGAGKSTLISLIPRFYEPQKGEILIDNFNINKITQNCLRNNIGIVQQNVFLFDDTIRENILYGNPEASDEDIIHAAKQANILDFILSLPNGFDTQVGERGVKLSGGQKQRIAIARVFLKNPSILIFDEATSSLDTESEHLISQAMDKLSHGRTTIIIAHRLSTIKNADIIYVMSEGEIIESGNHEKLIKKRKFYYNLYNKNLF
ncbi:MAG: ABC transporter ATP-binding protein [Candidatus Muiribacteriota bacterium]